MLNKKCFTQILFPGDVNIKVILIYQFSSVYSSACSSAVLYAFVFYSEAKSYACRGRTLNISNHINSRRENLKWHTYRVRSHTFLNNELLICIYGLRVYCHDTLMAITSSRINIQRHSLHKVIMVTKTCEFDKIGCKCVTEEKERRTNAPLFR